MLKANLSITTKKLREYEKVILESVSYNAVSRHSAIGTRFSVHIDNASVGEFLLLDDIAGWQRNSFLCGIIGRFYAFSPFGKAQSSYGR
jgi:hypothetical protein